MRLSEKLKTFSLFFMSFPECALNFEDVERKKTSITKVFPRLLTPKDAVTSMHERSCF